MSTHHPPSYLPPHIAFDDSLARELVTVEERLERERALATLDPGASPFVDYRRSLTAEGGILIRYKDIDRTLFLRGLRGFTWCCATGLTAYLSLGSASFGSGLALIDLGLFCFFTVIVRCNFEIFHSVEIQPDRMIVDGEDVFLASEIGDNWPRLEIKDGIGKRAVIAGVCGTRYIEYMTVNRADKCDFTPELLESHLHEAMRQMWDRVEVSFDAAA